MRYTHTETPKEFVLFLDGKEQTFTDGNPMTLGTFDTHSGDVTWGDPDNNLETGGTDIAYNGPEDCLIAHWATWSDNSANTGALHKTDEIFPLFERGAKPTNVIETATEATMQTDLDGLADTTIGDVPLGIRVEAVTGGGDFELVSDNITFNPRCSLQIQYMGKDTLTWVNTSGAVTDSTKFSTPRGGAITVIEAIVVRITVLDIVTKSAIQNARVLLEADTGGDLAAGTDILQALSNASGIVEDAAFRYTSDQPVTGRVRKGSSSTYYKTSNISGTITSAGLDLTILMVRDE